MQMALVEHDACAQADKHDLGEAPNICFMSLRHSSLYTGSYFIEFTLE